MKKYKILALIGKSGAGKDTIAQTTLKAHPDLFHAVVSATTRPPRDYEEDGVDYYFFTPEEFLSDHLKGEFIEAKEFRGWFYGTPISSLDPNKINLCVVTPSGVRDLLKRDDLDIKVILVECDARTRLMRALNREGNVDCSEVCRRFMTDEADFENIEFEHYIFHNPDSPFDSCLDLADPSSTLAHTIKNFAIAAS